MGDEFPVLPDSGNDTAEPDVEEEFEAFERLRKTMTRKQRDDAARTQPPPPRDELF